MGVRHALFPEPALGAPLRGCRLPDAILHGKRSYRPRSRAVRHFSARGIIEWGFSARFGWWLRHRPANQVKTRL